MSTILWADLSNLYVWAVTFVTLGFGAIGFYDDFLKVTRSTTKGFSGKVRLLAEFLIAGVAVACFMWIGDKPLSSSLAVPFFKDVLIPFGSFFHSCGRVRHRGGRQCGEHYRRAGWPCHRAGDDRGGELRADRLSGGQRGVRGISAGALS